MYSACNPPHNSNKQPPCQPLPTTQQSGVLSSNNCIVQEEHMPKCTIEYNSLKHSLSHQYGIATNMLEVTKQNNSIQQDFTRAIIDTQTGHTLKYCQLIKMEKIPCNLASLLCQQTWLPCPRHERHPRYDSIKFINKQDVPTGKTVTYSRNVCMHDHKRKNKTGQAPWLWVIKSVTKATSAHQLATSQPPNSCSIPPSPLQWLDLQH